MLGRGARRWTAGWLLVMGCQFAADGLGSGGDLDPGGSTTMERTTGSGSAGSNTTASGDGSGTGPTAGATSQGPETSGGTDNPFSTTTSGDTTGDAAPAISCADILLDNPAAATGFYEIAPPGATIDVPIDVFCDMQTDGGGWTLIARSVGGGHDEGEFGWGRGRGDPDDLAIPYSLNAAAAGLPFNEILAGNRGTGLDWGGRVYKIVVPADMIMNTDNGVQVSSIETLAGDCDPNGGPSMLRFVGHTNENRFFFFRDGSSKNDYGLWHNGWDTFYDIAFTCSNGAELNGDQGMLMVR